MHKLERIQKRYQLIFLSLGQRVVIRRRACCLPGVTLDGILFGQRQAIVHQAIASTKPPQRGSPDLIGGGRIFGQG